MHFSFIHNMNSLFYLRIFLMDIISLHLTHTCSFLVLSHQHCYLDMHIQYVHTHSHTLRLMSRGQVCLRHSLNEHQGHLRSLWSPTHYCCCSAIRDVCVPASMFLCIYSLSAGTLYKTSWHTIHHPFPPIALLLDFHKLVMSDRAGWICMVCAV